MKPVYLRPLFCEVCGKGDRVAFNRPHSLHKTKRRVSPNLQKYLGLLICQKCRRTLKRAKSNS